MKLKVEIIVTDPKLRDFGLPRYATSAAGACDLVALGMFEMTEDRKPDLDRRKPMSDEIALSPGQLVYFCVGFRMHIGDREWAAHVIPRSSASGIGIRLGNSVGFIDADYQGPIVVGVESRLRRGTVRISRGERIAQMYFDKIGHADWQEVDKFSNTTTRGNGAYGSTGRV